MIALSLYASVMLGLVIFTVLLVLVSAGLVIWESWPREGDEDAPER